MRWTALFLLASVAYGQAIWNRPGVNPPLLELKQFLELTDAQYAQIFQNIEQHQRTLASYQQRVLELRRDIAIETAREHPSSTELGTRYVEVEINCRLMNEEGEKLRTRNQALLTAPQRTKLQVLLDAIKLMPVVAQAQQASLLNAETLGGNFVPTTRLPVVSPESPIGVIGLLPSPSAVCGAGTAGSFLFPTPLSSEKEAH